MPLSRRMQILIAIRDGHPFPNDNPMETTVVGTQASESADTHSAGQADKTQSSIVAKNALPDIIHSEEVPGTTPSDGIPTDQTAGPRDSRSPTELTEPDTFDAEESDAVSGPPFPKGTAPSSVKSLTETPLQCDAHSEALEKPVLGQDPSNVPPATDASTIPPTKHNPGTGDGDAVLTSPAPAASSASHASQPAESSQQLDPTTDAPTGPTPRTLSDTYPDKVQLADGSTVATDNPAPKSPGTSVLIQEEHVILNDGDPNDGALPPADFSPDAWKARVYPIRDRAHYNWLRLSKLIERHEGTIREKWRKVKKSGKGKREKFLLKHWRNMVPERQPDLKLLLDWKQADGLPPLMQWALLCPFMNLQDLSEAGHLEQMLHSRGRHPMDHFAAQDLPLQRVSFLQHFGQSTDFDTKYFMVISWKGVTYIDDSEDTYGQLVHIDDRNVSDKLLADKSITYASTGVFLIHLQEGLYRFLLRLVNDLLTDNTTTLEHLFANEHERINPGMESGASPALQVVWLADERDEAPYTGIKAQCFTTENQLAQRRFNQLIVETKWKETLDHWRLLRHDPGYLKETMYRRYELGETICIQAGQFPSEPTIIWPPAVSSCLQEAFHRMHTWDTISRLITFLNDGELESRRRDGKESTPECTNRELALPFFSDFLQSCVKASIDNFITALKWKAHAKEWQYHDAHEDAREESSEIRYFKGLVGLLADDEKRAHVVPHTIIREMDYLVSSSPRAIKSPSAVRLMLPETVNGTLADLATWTGVWEDVLSSGEEMGLNVEINTAKLANKSELDRLEKLEKERAFGPDGPNPPESSRYRGCENLGPLSREAVRLGTPADGRFDYPIDKATRTMEEEKQIRQATRAMHRFWEESDKELVRARVFRHFGNVDVFKPPEMIDDTGEETVVLERANGYYHATLGIRLDVDKIALRIFKTMFVHAGTDGWDPQPVSWKEFQHALLEAGYKMFCRYVGSWIVVPPCSQKPARSDQCHILRQPRAGESLSVAALRRFGLRIRWAVKGRLDFSHFRLRAKKGKKNGKGTEEATAKELGEDTADESESETGTELDVWTAYPVLAKAKPNPDFSRESRC